MSRVVPGGPSCSRSPFMSTKHCRKNRSRLPPVGLARKLIMVRVNIGDGRRRRRPYVSWHQPIQPIAVCAGEARPDGTAKQVARQVRR